MKHPTQLRKDLDAILRGPFSFAQPNEVAVQNVQRILDALENHELDATYITESADEGLGIVWHSEFTPGRYAHIECTNDGCVTGMRADKNSPDSFKFWWVRGLTNQTDPGDLVLSLEEAIEHIRCYVWADYR